MRFWMESGAPKSKLVMGMPLYGQAFTLQKESVNGLNAPAPRKGLAGPYTRAAGFLAYYEICDMVRTKGFAVVQDEAEPRRIGPYAVKGNQWVGYDDVAMIRYKSEYIRKMGFAGGMVWALDLDDFNGVCGQGKHPLLTTIKNVLAPKIGAYPGITDGAGDDKVVSSPSQEQGDNEDNQAEEAAPEDTASEEAAPEDTASEEAAPEDTDAGQEAAFSQTGEESAPEDNGDESSEDNEQNETDNTDANR